MARMFNPPHPGLTLRDDVLPALGLNVTQAAEQLGVSRVALSRVLNGRAAISPEMALRIEAWLGVKRGGEARLWLAEQAPMTMLGRAFWVTFGEGGSRARYSAQRARRIENIRQALGGIDHLCSGTLLKRTKVCGKAGCRCATDPSARHGPYYEWGHMRGDKLVHRSVTAEQAALLEQAIAN